MIFRGLFFLGAVSLLVACQRTFPSRDSGITLNKTFIGSLRSSSETNCSEYWVEKENAKHKQVIQKNMSSVIEDRRCPTAKLIGVCLLPPQSRYQVVIKTHYYGGDAIRPAAIADCDDAEGTFSSAD